ncbi:hypothetical protein Tco_1052848, partial [Tanacetum coccineum]
WKALDDGDDVNDKLSLELRYIAKKIVWVLEVFGKCRALEVMFGVKRGFSAGSGSGGSIRRIQVMDTAYSRSNSESRKGAFQLGIRALV